MTFKPIKIAKVPGGYHVFVNDVPLVKDGKGVGIDRAKANLRTGGKGYKPPTSEEPMLFKKAGDATSLAHQVGRYLMNMGDFVSGYTEVVGVEGNIDSWWTRALRS